MRKLIDEATELPQHNSVQVRVTDGPMRKHGVIDTYIRAKQN